MSSGGRPGLLLVEDDAESRRMLRVLLEGEGLHVVGEAGDGEEAVEMARAVSPDVVLMDIRMPKMGGIEAARRIKEIAPSTQILMLTSYDGPFPSRSAEQVGAYAYLVKGCSAELIRDMVMQAWGYMEGLRYRAIADPSALGAPPA